jgi:hypothetical protein
MVSVCISTFNRAHLIGQMLASLICSARKSPGVVTECVVVLNVCTDTTRNVLDDLRRPLADAGIELVVLENASMMRGMCSYANAMRRASQAYAWLCADDDLVCEDTVSRIRDVLRQHKSPAVISLNWQSYEYDFSAAVGSPRLPRGEGGLYPHLFAFWERVGVMHLSFMPSLIVKRLSLLTAPDLESSQFTETCYAHVCAIVQEFSAEPLYAIPELCIKQRLNYRISQADSPGATGREPTDLTATAPRALAAQMALVRVFRALDVPDRLVDRHIQDVSANPRFAFFLLVARASLPEPAWRNTESEVRSVFGRIPAVRLALRLAPLVPRRLIVRLARSRDLLRRIHRLTVAVRGR